MELTHHTEGPRRAGSACPGQGSSISRLFVLIGLALVAPTERGSRSHCKVGINASQSFINSENLAAGRQLREYLFLEFPLLEGEEWRPREVNRLPRKQSPS